MNDTKFTPGPWRWSDQYSTTDERYTWSLVGSPEYGILSCDGEINSPQANTKADAALIAAAPDLYAALNDCAVCLELLQMKLGTPLDCVIDARAALAKARGES